MFLDKYFGKHQNFIAAIGLAESKNNSRTESDKNTKKTIDAPCCITNSNNSTSGWI